LGLGLLQEARRDDAKDGLDRLRAFSAIYFGAVGAPDVPDDITLWGLRLAICQGFDQYVNLRPTRILQGLSSPLRDCKRGDLDWVIVRENSEGEYAGQGGRAHRGFSRRKSARKLRSSRERWRDANHAIRLQACHKSGHESC